MSPRKGSLLFVLSLAGLVSASVLFRADLSRAAAGSLGPSLVGTLATRHVVTVEAGGKEATMEIYGFSHEVVSPRDAASGLPTGKRQHKPVVVAKPSDDASALLMADFLQGTTLDKVRIVSSRQSSRTGPMEPYLYVELENTLITSYQMAPADSASRRNMGHEVREHVAFTYQKITWTWADGTTLSDTWELSP